MTSQCAFKCGKESGHIGKCNHKECGTTHGDSRPCPKSDGRERTFNDFMLNATPEEKRKVYTEVAIQASKDQREMMRKSDGRDGEEKDEEAIGELFDASKEVAEFVKLFHEVHRCWISTCSVCNKFAVQLAGKFASHRTQSDLRIREVVEAMVETVKRMKIDPEDWHDYEKMSKYDIGYETQKHIIEALSDAINSSLEGK